MKVIIAGSRDLVDFRLVGQALEASGFEVTEVVSGCCRGPDLNGQLWAEFRAVTVTKFPADWEAYGPSAGPRRNAQMADYADALVAIWDGKSRGTRDMIQQMVYRKKRFYVWLVK